MDSRLNGENAVNAPQGPTAHSLGLVGCPHCGQVSQMPEGVGNAALCCPACGQTLHAREPRSIARTFLFCIAAAVLFVPSNVTPIIHSNYFGVEFNNTILSGIADFWSSRDYFVATVIFTASILIPLLKLSFMFYYCWVVVTRTPGNPLRRMRGYRFIAFVGRLSMLDIFVVGVLVALVQFGGLVHMWPGMGALYFSLVVICTLAATTSFDPRLFWDMSNTGNP